MAAKFTPEHIAQIKRLAGLKVGHFEEKRQSEANPEVNPHVYGAHQAILAHSYATNDLHGEWQKIAASPEYQAATPGQRLRIQRDHLTQFHANNPLHYSDTLLGVHGKAQKAQHDAQVAHRQAEHGKLTAALGGATTASSGGAPSTASIREQLGAGATSAEAQRKGEIAELIAEQTSAAPAVSTQRRIAEELGSGIPGESDQQQASLTTGPSISPEAAKEALKAAKFKNLPSEQVEVGGLKGTRNIEEHPELSEPANKRLMDAFAANHWERSTEKHVARRAKYLTNRGIPQTDYDAAQAQDAALHAMYQAAAKFDPSLGKDFDEYVRESMNQAIDGNLMQQHRTKTGGAAIAAQKQVDSDTKGSAAPVRTLADMTEEEKQAILARHGGTVSNKPHFSTQLSPEQQARLAALGKKG